ncbi:hypothetical protein AB4Z48_16195 [Cupriavidus sp. 2TAF22]|uniref:hypothetical protein n=1 Tax=unclassified Cupriavidus TaxID=2640874 RepID=UPI003F9109A5
MQSRSVATVLQALILAASAVTALHVQTASASTVNEARNVYTDGARGVQEPRSVYTDGARGALESRSPYTDGADSKGASFTLAGMDRTGVSAPPDGAA